MLEKLTGVDGCLLDSQPRDCCIFDFNPVYQHNHGRSTILIVFTEKDEDFYHGDFLVYWRV